MVLLDSTISLNKVSLPFLCGKNPRKVNSCVGKPEADNAAITAEAPGIGITSTLSRRLFLILEINIVPGSEIVGVPASDTKARFLPSSNNLKILSNFDNLLRE